MEPKNEPQGLDFLDSSSSLRLEPHPLRTLDVSTPYSRRSTTRRYWRQKDMTGEPKASQSPSEANKTRYHASIVEYFICSSLVNSYTNY
jgi:hypothetical protein